MKAIALTPVVLALVLSACGQQESPPAATQAEPAPPAAPAQVVL